MRKQENCFQTLVPCDTEGKGTPLLPVQRPHPLNAHLELTLSEQALLDASEPLAVKNHLSGCNLTYRTQDSKGPPCPFRLRGCGPFMLVQVHIGTHGGQRTTSSVILPLAPSHHAF